MNAKILQKQRHLYVRGIADKTIITNTPQPGDQVLEPSAKEHLLRLVNETSKLKEIHKSKWREQYAAEHQMLPPDLIFYIR